MAIDCVLNGSNELVIRTIKDEKSEVSISRVGY